MKTAATLTCYKTTVFKVFSVLLPILLVLLVQIPFAAAQNKQDTKTSDIQKQPADLKITSDKMIASKDKSTVEFTGNVKAVRADSVLLAKSVKVFLHTSKTKIKGQSNVRRILATDNVEYSDGERKATCDQADYDTAKEILVLTGDKARLLTGKSWISGKKITLFKADGRVVVEGTGETRVEAFFDADDQNGSFGAP